MKRFINEFKAFAVKGNVVDMAVGVIIGGAFGKIVSSLVADVIMPIITFMSGATDFSQLSFKIKDPVIEQGKVITEGIVIKYGNFLQNVIDFLIIAFVIFMMLKFIMKLTTLHKKEETVINEEKKVTSEELLTEIRDLLKENKQ
ncbi:MAG: large-conductance mechanosensitive channel protein MscL [Coprobacillus sp.]